MRWKREGHRGQLVCGAFIASIGFRRFSYKASGFAFDRLLPLFPGNAAVAGATSVSGYLIPGSVIFCKLKTSSSFSAGNRPLSCTICLMDFPEARYSLATSAAAAYPI
jgi:hypothetical protein